MLFLSKGSQSYLRQVLLTCQDPNHRSVLGDEFLPKVCIFGFYVTHQQEQHREYKSWLSLSPDSNQNPQLPSIPPQIPSTFPQLTSTPSLASLIPGSFAHFNHQSGSPQSPPYISFPVPSAPSIAFLTLFLTALIPYIASLTPLQAPNPSQVPISPSNTPIYIYSSFLLWSCCRVTYPQRNQKPFINLTLTQQTVIILFLISFTSCQGFVFLLGMPFYRVQMKHKQTR